MYLNVKMTKGSEKYDWDDIDVGNNQLNHSQNFFSKKHFEHERLDEMEFLGQAMIKTDLNKSIEHEQYSDENKENLKTSFFSPAVNLQIKELESSLEDNDGNNHSRHHDGVKSPFGELLSPVDAKYSQLGGLKSKCKESAKPVQVTAKVNLAYQWSTQKQAAADPSKGAISKRMPPPPQAYLAKDIYKRNREEAEKRRSEEERKKREFRSRPAPNFSANHEQLLKRKPVHAVTVTKTPQVLKKSREADERRKKMLEEWKLKNQPPKFEHRPPTVLKEKPFVPEKNPHIVKQCPFNLNTEKRLEERKQYDEQKRKVMEYKQKQVEIVSTKH